MELTASEVWTRIRASAQGVLPEQTYRTWLASTEAVSLSDDMLVVSAPTKLGLVLPDGNNQRPCPSDRTSTTRCRFLEKRCNPHALRRSSCTNLPSCDSLYQGRCRTRWSAAGFKACAGSCILSASISARQG